MKKITKFASRIVATVSLFGLATLASAQTLTDIGATPPTPGANDISQLSNVGTVSQPDGLNYYIDNASPPGQTFTTGSNPAGYILNSVALLTDAANQGGNVNSPQPSGYTLYIYSISGSTATLVVSYPSIGAGTFTYILGDWLQVSGLSLQLNPNTVYAFTFRRGNNGWENLDTASGNLYAGGEICLIPPAGGTVTYSSSHSYDAAFDVGLTPATAATPPSIVTAPASQPVVLGTPVTLTVGATGVGVTYQWQAAATNSTAYTNLVNGGIFAGVNTASLTITNFQAGNVANYIVVAANTSGSVTNDGLNGDFPPATLTVSSNLLANSSFELPGTGKIGAGFDAAGHDIPYWSNTGGLYGDSGVQPGGNTGSWESYLQTSDGGAYQISGHQIQANESFTLTWFAKGEWNGGSGTFDGTGPNDPKQTVEILTAPTATSAYVATITNAITSNGLPGGQGWIQYTLTYNSTPADIGKYIGVSYVTAHVNGDNKGTTWSGFDDFSLVIQPPGSAPVIATPPASVTQVLGSTVTFTVAASGSGLNYRWQAGATGSGVYTNITNGGQFSGANTASLVLTNFQTGNQADYVVIVSNSGGTVTSTPPATLTADLSLPSITTYPAGQSAYSGTNVTLTVEATGAVSYQWEAGAVSSGVYTNIPGANAASLVLTNVQDGNQADYVVVVSNGSGSADSTSAPATLTVVDSAPTLVTDATATPSAAYVGYQNLNVLSATYVGSLPLIYQWQFSPNASGTPVTPVSASATNTTLSLTNLQANQAGYYRLQVTNRLGSVYSSWAQVQLLPAASATYTWSTPVSYSTPTELTAAQILSAPAGAYFEAADFGGGLQTVTVGSTVYTFDNSGASASASGGGGYTTGAFAYNTGDSGLNSALNGFYYDGGQHLITIHNLTVGQLYSVQLFGLDDRIGPSARQSTYQDPNNANDISAVITAGDNQYLVGTFTASSADMTIQQNLLPSGSGSFSALVVRTLTLAPPAPVIVRSGSSLQITWTAGTLLQATNITGPWTTNSSTPSTITVTPTAPQMYYQVQAP